MMNRPDSAKREARKRLNKNFRQEAVEFWRQSGKTGAEVAAELGIRPNNLYNWAEQAETHAQAVNSSSAGELAGIRFGSRDPVAFLPLLSRVHSTIHYFH